MEEKTVWQKYAGTSVRSLWEKIRYWSFADGSDGRRPCPVGGCAGNRQDHDGKIPGTFHGRKILQDPVHSGSAALRRDGAELL